MQRERMNGATFGARERQLESEKRRPYALFQAAQNIGRCTGRHNAAVSLDPGDLRSTAAQSNHCAITAPSHRETVHLLDPSWADGRRAGAEACHSRQPRLWNSRLPGVHHSTTSTRLCGRSATWPAVRSDRQAQSFILPDCCHLSSTAFELASARLTCRRSMDVSTETRRLFLPESCPY